MTERRINYDREHSRTEDNYRRWPVRVRIEHMCVVCGDAFRSASTLALFCSERCRNDRHMHNRKQARHNRRATAVSACSCGAALEPGPTGRLPRHCSAACRQRAYRARRAGA